MENGDIVVSRSILRRAWSRPQRGGRAEQGVGEAERLHKFFERFEKVDSLMLSAGPPEGGFVPKPPFHRERQDYIYALKLMPLTH